VENMSEEYSMKQQTTRLFFMFQNNNSYQKNIQDYIKISKKSKIYNFL